MFIYSTCFFKFWIKRPTVRDIVDTPFRSSSLVHSFFHSVSFFLILRLAEFSLCILTFKGANRFGHFLFFFGRFFHRWTTRLKKNLLNSVLGSLLLMFKGFTESRFSYKLKPNSHNYCCIVRRSWWQLFYEHFLAPKYNMESNLSCEQV